MIISVLALFAISASAADIPEWTDITTVDGMPDKATFGDDGRAGATSRVLMSDGVTYPAYYICKNQASLSLDLSTLNTKASKSYGKADIIKIEIPKGTTTVSAALNLSSGCSGLVSVDIPYGVTTISQLAFRSSGISNPIVVPDSCTKIEQYAFKGSNIPSIVIPSSVTSFGSDCVSECPSITEVYCKCANIPEKAFYDNDKLSSIKLENTVIIGNNAFCNPNGGILNITSLELPSTLTSIGQYAFTRTKIESLVIPASVTTMGSAAFQGCTTIEKLVVLGPVLATEAFKDCPALKEVVFTENFTTFGTSALGTTPNNSTFIAYYTGTDHERIKTLCSGTSRFSQAKYYSYEDYKNENYTYNKFMVIYDANLCEVAFDGVHSPQEGEADCVNALGCSRCPLVYEEALGHEFDLEKGASVKNIVYKSFGADGHYEIKCARCDECDSSTVISAIFAPRGYSVNPNGTGFATGFLINQSSLKAYEDFYNTKLTFGILIFNPTYLDDSSLFVDGKVNCSRGVVQVSMDTIYSSCSLSVNGFTSAHEGLELVFAGFAYEGDDTDNIQVFQKEYNSTQENPVSSPMSKKVTRGNFVLYSVCLGSIKAPAVMPNKSELDEFLKA